jgi:hypothetical protein
MRQVARDAGVKDVRARTVGHDVDEESSVPGHAFLFLLRHPKTQTVREENASFRPEPFFRRREESCAQLIRSMGRQSLSVTSERWLVPCLWITRFRSAPDPRSTRSLRSFAQGRLSARWRKRGRFRMTPESCRAWGKWKWLRIPRSHQIRGVTALCRGSSIGRRRREVELALSS